MTTMKRGLVDLSSVIWTCLLAGKDVEFGRHYLIDDEGTVTELSRNAPPNEAEVGKRCYVNSAQYGYELAVSHIVAAMNHIKLVPRDLIFVMEGKNSKADRQSLHPGYKAGRNKVEQQYEQFNLCKQQVLTAFLAVGSQQCWQDGGVEADDVLGYLALNLDGERTIISGDKDLAQVVGRHPDIHHYRQGIFDQNPFGDFDPSLIPVWIAIVGDSGDKIPGAKGFGATSGAALVASFGDEGLKLLEGLIKSKDLGRLEEDVAEMPRLQKLMDDAPGVYLSYELGRLRVEKVNTLKRPLMWKAGMVKSRDDCQDDHLRKFSTVTRLVSAENYGEAVEFFKKHLPSTPYVAFDIETSTPDASDEWLIAQGKDDGVDVFGSELTGMSLTFGANMQYTVYLTHEHVEEPGVTNLSLAQMRDFMDLIPRGLVTYVHNAAFELPICHMEWGNDWAADPEYHGFLRNVRDTKIGSSYVNENTGNGLKGLSGTVLEYEQQTYESVTRETVAKLDWDGTGKVLATSSEEVDGGEVEFVTLRRKMNQLTARHVLSYGADDTICTSALANHFQIIMEIEKTWSVYQEVETFPAYLTAKAFVDGVDFSLEHMAEMEREDTVAYDAAWTTLRAFLIKIGYEGTTFVPLVALAPADIKRACLEVTGLPLETKVRTTSKMLKLMEQEIEHDKVPTLCHMIEAGALDNINEMMERNFLGEPQLDLASPKQVKHLLYDAIGMPINFINDVTPLERINKPEMADAAKRFKQRLAGKDITITADDLVLLKGKATSDDDAIQYALAFDDDGVLTPESRTALLALGTMKRVMTRRSLYYKNYWGIKHWKDGKIHASTNQCAAVTRRYSMSGPNLQQLPKKGEAVRFRGGFKPHHRDAVISSIDFSGQELRLAAERSQDENMLACYVGNNLKDLHSITAAGAMKLKWGAQAVQDAYAQWGQDTAPGVEGDYTLFLRLLRSLGKGHEMTKKADDLRKDSKNVNFAAQFGGRAPKLAQALIMRVSDAQLFLDARAEMFPDVDVAAQRAADFTRKHGYALTLMGARRHLRDAMLTDERGAEERATRQAWNMEIQGSAGEMTKLAMSRLWKSGALFKYDARFIAPVHDELVTSVHRDHAVEFLRIKHDCMVAAYASMRVPILGSISLGSDFADQIECGDWFIEERIRKALNDIFEMKEAA